MKTTTEIMELARQRYLASLPLPRSYRPGKFTALGFPKEGRATVCQVRGPGVLKRLWTTHAAGTNLKLYLFIDDAPEPVLAGMAHDIARAAEGISCPGLPLGGFLDGKSVSLYLPYRFETCFRLEAEATGETGDGPYWQLDYALHTDEKCGRVEQIADGDRVELAYRESGNGPEAQTSQCPWLLLEDEFAVAGCSPHSVRLDGPAVVRRLTLSGEALDKLWLRLCFDTDPSEDGHLSGPFQVDAPLRYLVGPFYNAGVGRLGTQMEIHFPMPFRERADGDGRGGVRRAVSRQDEGGVRARSAPDGRDVLLPRAVLDGHHEWVRRLRGVLDGGEGPLRRRPSVRHRARPRWW